MSGDPYISRLVSITRDDNRLQNTSLLLSARVHEFRPFRCFGILFTVNGEAVSLFNSSPEGAARRSTSMGRTTQHAVLRFDSGWRHPVR